MKWAFVTLVASGTALLLIAGAMVVTTSAPSMIAAPPPSPVLFDIEVVAAPNPFPMKSAGVPVVQPNAEHLASATSKPAPAESWSPGREPSPEISRQSTERQRESQPRTTESFVVKPEARAPAPARSDIGVDSINKPARPTRLPPTPPGNYTLASRNPGVFTTTEIYRLKRDLRLTAEQETYWPPVENALRKIGAQQADLLRSGRTPEEALNGDSARGLFFTARPLLNALREDQKDQIRRRARMMGLESVVSII